MLKSPFHKKAPASTASGGDTPAPLPVHRRPRKKIIILSVVGVLVLASAGIGIKALFSSDEAAVALTDTTTYGSLATTVEGTGTTLPGESTTITTASTAEILAVHVAAGDTVQEGDLLYVQDDSEIDTLIEGFNDEISEQQDQLESLYEQLSSVRESISALTVTAPFSGRLTEVTAKSGDNVQNGGRLAVLTDDSKVTLTQYFSYVYEDDIYIGMPATVSIADLTLTPSGTVTDIQKVDRVTSEGTRCFSVTVTLDNPGALQEGMSGTGYLTSRSNERIYPSIEGTLACLRTETLSAEAGGTLLKVNAVDYQRVSSGDTLFVIDGTDYQTQLASAQKKITQAEEKIASLNEKIVEAEESRADYTVTAPLTGRVITVGVRAGESPRQAGMTAVMIYNLDIMTISANIDELDIDNIEMGMEVNITRSGSEIDTTYTGIVSEISYEATNSNSVAYFPISIEINSEGELSAGVNISYSIAFGDATEGVLAPVSALKTTDEGTCLFVQADTAPENAIELEGVEVPDGFYAVPVEVGTVGSQCARILSGVEEDTTVFTRYQQAAPSSGNTTSDDQTQDGQQGFPGGDFSFDDMPSGGSMPSGGNMPGGGSMPGGDR